MVTSGTVVDVGQGDAVFLPDRVAHDHENRAAVPLAIALAAALVSLTVATVLTRMSRHAVELMAALLVVGTTACANPLMNHWYFIGVRPAAAHGAPMPAVPVGPAAIVVLDGEVSVVVGGGTTNLSAQSGATIARGAEATVQPRSGGARVIVVQLLPAG